MTEPTRNEVIDLEHWLDIFRHEVAPPQTRQKLARIQEALRAYATTLDAGNYHALADSCERAAQTLADRRPWLKGTEVQIVHLREAAKALRR